MDEFVVLIEKQNFKIELNETLNSEDFSRMRILYTPLVGPVAISLYSLLYDFNIFNKTNNASLKWEIFKKILGISFQDITLAKNKLEAVGLLRTFEKANNRTFIYSLNRPSLIEKFKQNVFLYKKIIKNIGESLFEKIEFQMKKINIQKNEYKDVTKKYQEIFEIPNEKNENTLEINHFKYSSIEEAIEKINPLQFINYVSNKKPSPAQIKLINSLEIQNLSPIGINHIINYTFEINGEIVNNHIEKIANDLLSKSITSFENIKEEMHKAKNKRKKNLQKIEINNDDIIKENNIEDRKIFDKKWNDIFNTLGSEL